MGGVKRVQEQARRAEAEGNCPIPPQPAGNCAPILGSSTTRGPIRPWATGHRPRCSARPGMSRAKDRRRRKVHRNGCWYHWDEQWDSRSIPPQSCPFGGVHLRESRGRLPALHAVGQGFEYCSLDGQQPSPPQCLTKSTLQVNL
jgi:hypothetical protein